jgi:mono/diheme cytochrome c family protein
VRAALAALIVLAAAGCGGTPSATRGHEVFGRACARCHTLTGHDTHSAGGDLALGRLSLPDVISFTRQMPVTLSNADVHTVAAYVVAHERR